jgi:hypothetical protein
VTYKPPPPWGMLHLFHFDPTAVYIPPEGNPLGVKYKLGAWQCVMCLMQLDAAVYWDMDHGDDCSGAVNGR